MTCEWAEGNLSAYLDDALDPQLRKDVGAHIETCARCQALTEEYRQNDHLIATMRQVAPPDTLRQRIFESPAYAALTRDLEREDSRAPAPLAPRRAAIVARVLIPVAALLTVSLGAALLFRQGLLPFGAHPTARTQTTAIGGPGDFTVPLSAGPRMVYLSDGALWSVAEYAPNATNGDPGLPQRLTAPSAQVVAWSVSPLGGHDGGAHIAFVDGHTGAVHVVRSDGLADTVVGSVSDALAASASSLVWSPDGAQLAYISRASNGSQQVTIYAQSGAHVSTLSNQQEPILKLLWRADSSALAVVTTTQGAPTIYTLTANAGSTSVAAIPDVSQASVGQIAWNGSHLTWSAIRDGSVVGIYTLDSGSAQPTNLTPGARFDAAAFTAAHGGEWLLAGNGALSLARLSDGSLTQVASPAGVINQIGWAPNGAAATLRIGDRLDLWSGATGLIRLASQVGQTAPAWSPDGTNLAVVQGQSVMLYPVSGGAGLPLARLSDPSSLRAMAWATDGRNLALAQAHGILLVTPDGAHQTLLTSHPADGAEVEWSVAR